MDRGFIIIIQRKDTDVTLCCIIKQFIQIGFWSVFKSPLCCVKKPVCWQWKRVCWPCSPLGAIHVVWDEDWGPEQQGHWPQPSAWGWRDFPVYKQRCDPFTHTHLLCLRATCPSRWVSCHYCNKSGWKVLVYLFLGLGQKASLCFYMVAVFTFTREKPLLD